VNKSGYYKYLKNKGKKKKETSNEKQLKETISIIYYEHHTNFGYRKIHGVLRDTYNISISEKVVRRLMRELGLKCQAKKKKNKPMSVSKVTSAGHIYDNLLKRDFNTTKLDEKWVTDVTEIPVGDRKLYVSALMDLHNNGILGYQISETHDVQLVEDSLLYALEIRKIDNNIILHSDRGMPYRSNRWKELVDLYSINPSMSRKANALDNACIECFFSMLKSEKHELKTVKCLEEATELIHEYIRYYNHKRIQGVLNYRTPHHYANAC
jgi:putative transposase